MRSTYFVSLVPFLGVASGYSPHSFTVRSSLNSSSNSTCNPVSKFFSQPIDHSSNASTNGTFDQQYQLITDYYKPGGPILLYQGAESTTITCADVSILVAWGKEIGAAVASIEHRYFGLSLPFGNDSYTAENLEYLTLENVMLDSARFVEWAKSEIGGGNETQTVIVGGSYGGWLVAMMRLNHPESFQGAISLAAPFLAFGNETEHYNDWYNYVSNSFEDQSSLAASNIRASWDFYDELFKDEAFDAISSSLKLCQPVNSTVDKDTLTIYLVVTFSVATQFNYPTPIAWNVSNPLSYVVNLAESAPANNSLAIINETAWLWYGKDAQAYETGCLDWNPPLGTQPDSSIEATPFDYILCTYFPLFVSTNIASDTIFSPITANYSSRIESCQAQFNITPMTAQAAREKFHWTIEEIENSTRIVFSYGGFDPTTASGVQSMPSTADRNASRRLFVSGIGHGYDLFPTIPEDTPVVVDARNAELQTIKEWVGIQT